MKRLLTIICAFLLMLGVAVGQIPSRTDVTATPLPEAGHDYIHAPVETVNPANGSVSVRIGVPTPPSRGFTLPFSFAYDSNGVYYIASANGLNFGTKIAWATNKSMLSQGGWSYTVPMMSVQNNYLQVYDSSLGRNVDCSALTDYVMQDADGNRHNLGISVYDNHTNPNCQGVRDNYITSAGEGGIAATTGDWTPGLVKATTVTKPNGTIYQFSSHLGQPSGYPCQLQVCNPTTWPPTTITDKNGNQLTISTSSGALPLQYTDTIGRTALSISGFGGADQVTVSGLGGPYQVHWPSPLQLQSFDPHPNLKAGNQCSWWGGTPALPPINVIDKITLPNNQQFTFSYDPTYGTLAKITYPSGGYVRYVWGVNPQSEDGQWPSNSSTDPTGFCNYTYDTPAISQRYVSFDGSTEVLRQIFAYSPTTWNSDLWSTKQTTVTTTDLTRNTTYSTVYTYSWVQADNPPNTGDAVHQLPVEQTVVYDDTNGSPLRTVTKSWINERMLSWEKTALDNGQLVAERDWTYDPTLWNPDAALRSEEVIENDEYDYGSGSRGLLLRKTLTSYAWDGNRSDFLTDHILDRPYKVQVIDSNGVTVDTGVTFLYDQKADLTDYEQWLNNSGSSYLDTQHGYDVYGNITSTTDPAGNMTSYSYADNFATGCNPVVNSSNAYPTQITYPSTGVSHVESFSYNCSTGKLASSTDQNSNTTSYHYSDPFSRLTDVYYPSGFGTAHTDYYDAPGSNFIETMRKDQNNTVWDDSVDTYDGLFQRTSHSRTNAEATPWNRTDTCYDGDGRASFTSYPYQANSATGGPNCLGTGDTLVYDSLGRIKMLTHSDASTVTTSYTGRATDVRDEGNGSRSLERVSQSDALGRLTNVCEVTNQPQQGVNPTTCGLDYAATGFPTSYNYDGISNLKSVSQMDNSVNRTFNYDMLSRLTQAINPESGTTTYVYDGSGAPCAAYPGELIQKSDGRQIRTCLQYDALHRLTGKSYPDDGTPSVADNYDETNRYGRVLTNTRGRKSSESTAGTGPTGEVFSYDALGRVIDNSQCTPQNCGSNSPFPVTYPSYNVLGSPFSATNGIWETLTYGYDSAGELYNISSNLSDSNHPPILINNIHYNAFGLLVLASMGSFPETESRSYTARGWLSSVSVLAGSGTQSHGTITINGSEQSQQTGYPTHATGYVTIDGQEQSIYKCNDWGKDCHTIYDTGRIWITVNGYGNNVTYNQNSMPSSLASALVTTINNDVNAYVTASLDGTIVRLTSKATGSASNYPLTATTSTNDPGDFPGGSFTATSSGPNLSGGTDGTWTYDNGNVWAVINGTQSTTSYGRTDNTYTVASSLAQAINANNGALVTASPNQNLVNLVSTGRGINTNYPLSASSSSNNFPSPSFTTVTSGMSGGSGGSLYSLGVTYYPNGDVRTSNDTVNGNWNYTYDDFNRLSTAIRSDYALGCSESYDRFGNRWSQQPTSGKTCTAFTNSFSGNRMQTGYQYDRAGNILNDGTYSYSYDAEGRISAINNGGVASYVYNAEGQRVRRTVSGVSADYVYDLAGHLVAEFGTNGVWNRGEIYGGGMHVATYQNSTTYFNHSDWLATERMRTTVGATVYSQWTSYPFGEGSSAPNPGPTHFTGKERDSETGLDNFDARFYGANMGRFMTPDWSAKAEPVPYSKLANPQSLNLYVYVLNNPLTNRDADGHCGEQAGQMASKECVAQQRKTDQVAMAAERAAIGLTRTSVANHDPHEYGGLILQRSNDGKISATSPIRGQERQVDVDSIKVPKGYTVVGEYHTHPHATAMEGQGPSPTDIYRLRTPALAGRTAYVGDSYSGAVYRYNQSEPVKGPFDTAVYGTKIGTIP